MENNKEKLENIETSESAVNETELVEETKKEKKVKIKKPKIKKLKNQLLLKRGGYSLAITAIFIAAVIVVNILVSALADRFDLEFDLSADKVNTMTQDNIDYIKKIDKDITVTVCAAEDNYVSYMQRVQSALGVSQYEDYSDYYNQTITFINKYNDYNKKIKINYVDMYNDASFAEIEQKYSNENLTLGDIIVSTMETVDGKEKERYKKLAFSDIYTITESNDESSYYYSMMGYGTSTITENNIETALTSAMAYVLGSDIKKVTILSGHGKEDMETYAEAYAKLLKDNNFEVEIVSTIPVLEISEDTDVIAIIAPTTDLFPEEVDTIVKFLDNNGKLGRGLIYFGSATCPKLPNLYELLADWGINVVDGKVFMTDSDYCVAGDPLTINTPINYGSIFVTSNNQPIITEDTEEGEIKVSSIKTAPYAVVAPLSANSDWTGYSEDDLDEFTLATQAVKTDYIESEESEFGSKEVSGCVLAFSSIDFIASQWAEESGVYNKDFTLALTQTAVQAEETGISFVSKSITNESFTSQVTEAQSNAVRIIFMILLPVAMLGLALFIFIKRKDS